MLSFKLTTSILHWIGLEDVSSPHGLDCWWYFASSCTWIGKLTVPNEAKADFKALVSLHIWAAVSSYEVLGDFGEQNLQYEEQD